MYRLIRTLLATAVLAGPPSAHSQAVEEPPRVKAAPGNLPPRAAPSAGRSETILVKPPARRSEGESPEQNLFYDRDNPAYSILQKANDALAGFPLDKKGYVDWMGALKNGVISPRADLTGKGQMQVLDLDIIMRNTKQMPHVRFPHRSHTLWLACSNCHPDIFPAKAGATAITMPDIFAGKFCGTCHDRVAFLTFFSCERCHSVPHEGSGRAWW